MYILLVDGGYPSTKYKLNGIFALDQAKALALSGHKVVFAALDMRSARRWRKWGFESIEVEGVQIEAINLPCGALPWGMADKIRVLAFKSLYKRIEQKHGRPDIIHSHFINISYAAAHLSIKEAIPLVVTEHYSEMNQEVISSYMMKLGKFTYARANCIIAVSKYLKNNLDRNFGVNAVVIPNIVDLSNFNYCEATQTGDNEDKDIYIKNDNIVDKSSFTIISVGALNSNKRMDLLIESFYSAFKGKENYMLYIYGDGSERDRLQSLINKLKLEDNVFLLGVAHRKEISLKMRECDCFALFSKLETFGVSFIEALSLGIPVISTKSGGPEDFITKQNGIVVSDDSISSLADALITMHNEIQNYDKDEISKSIKLQFEPEAISLRLSVIYLSVLDAKEQRIAKTND